jgi:8-amino-7-oxononanoate synthase
MPSPQFAELLELRLSRLRDAGLLRDPANPLRDVAHAAALRRGRSLIDLSSNDYLALAALPVAAAGPGGAGASRLIHGTRRAHRQLESDLANWLGAEEALLFASGYSANLGLVSALAEPDDLVLSDELNHASLIDGCRLSRAEVRVFPHRDLAALERALVSAGGGRVVWVVTEAYFSMDGTACDVAGLASILERHPNAHLVIDEAHSLGVYGPQGRGLAAAAGYVPAATMGSFGKAFGCHGAFVAGSRDLCVWLWNRARSFVFSTAPSPALAEAVSGRLELVSRADVPRRHLQSLCQAFHVQLHSLFPERHIAGSSGPITPLLMGDEHTALAVAQALAEEGILTQAVRPPTVPRGTSRIRMTLGAHLDSQQLEVVVEVLREILPKAP